MMVTRSGITSLALAGMLAAGCQSVSSSRWRSAEREGNARLEEKDFPAAQAAFEKAAALAVDPDDRIRAALGAGRAFLLGGSPERALKLLYDLRLSGVEPGLVAQVHDLMGQAYFQLADHALARRYLQKALEDTRGEARQLILSRIVVCCRALDEPEEARAFRERLSKPLSEEVLEVLALKPAARRPAPLPVAREESGEGGNASRRPGRAPWPPPAPREPLPGSSESLLILKRSDWSASALRSNIVRMGLVERLTVHHSGGDSFWGSSRGDAAAEIRRIQRYHQNSKGWADIGYHYIIDRSGMVWQGRPLRYQGAHARGSANNGNVGIVVLGNYLHQELTSAQRQSLEHLVTKLSDCFTIPPERVHTHREILHGKTACPGPVLARCVNEIRTNLRQRLVAYKP